MPRPRVHDAVLRARLVDQAAETMATEGADRLSLRSLAADCGTSTSAVYSLFGGKSGLIHAVVAEAATSFEVSQRRALNRARSTSPGQQLVRLGLAYRRWAVQHPHLYRVMFVEPSPHEAGIGDDPAIRPLRDVVEACVETGTFRSATDVRAAIVSIWASVHGFVMLETAGLSLGSARAAERGYRAHLDAIVRAWAA